jgi:alcohol dehydrogenase (cytochrome c)
MSSTSHLRSFLGEPTLIQPSGIGGTNWSPMSYSPDTGFFYVPGAVRTSAFARYGDTCKKGKQYNGGTQAAPIGSAMSGTWTAVAGSSNKIAWQKKCAVPRRQRWWIDHDGRWPRLSR